MSSSWRRLWSLFGELLHSSSHTLASPHLLSVFGLVQHQRRRQMQCVLMALLLSPPEAERSGYLTTWTVWTMVWVESSLWSHMTGGFLLLDLEILDVLTFFVLLYLIHFLCSVPNDAQQVWQAVCFVFLLQIETNESALRGHFMNCREEPSSNSGQYQASTTGMTEDRRTDGTFTNGIQSLMFSLIFSSRFIDSLV